VVDTCSEWGYEVDRAVLEVLDPRNVGKEIGGDMFVSRCPNLAITLIDDVILVRVLVSDDSAQWVCKDGEDVGVNGKAILLEGWQEYGGSDNNR
jgi:hypothetical protein